MTITHWLPDEDHQTGSVRALCLGTGRFLRSVLVPTLVGMMNENEEASLSDRVGPVLIQPRGTSMIQYMHNKTPKGTQAFASYEVDTILPSGDTATTKVPCSAVFSLSSPEGKHSLVECLPQIMKR